MANVLPDRSIADIQKLATQGLGIRAVARALGIAKNTVTKYYPRQPGACGCGLAAGHNGWCKVRYAQSPARQAFHASRTGKSVAVPRLVRFSRVSAQQTTNSRWNGSDGKYYEPLQSWEMYGALGEAARVTRKYPPEFKEDVFQELALRAIEGRVGADEMERAGKYFLMRHYKPHFDSISLDDAYADGNSKYVNYFAAE